MSSNSTSSVSFSPFPSAAPDCTVPVQWRHVILDTFIILFTYIHTYIHTYLLAYLILPVTVTDELCKRCGCLRRWQSAGISWYGLTKSSVLCTGHVQAASAHGEGFMFGMSDSDDDDSPAGSDHNNDDDDDDGSHDADRSRCTTSWAGWHFDCSLCICPVKTCL